MGEDLKAMAGGREVTVQVLRVDGKKMTLQFFKQLPKRNYFVEGATPDPALLHWGRVSYLLQDGGDAWLVAEVDGQLYRCAIYKEQVSRLTLKFHEQSREDYEQRQAAAPEAAKSVFAERLAALDAKLPGVRAAVDLEDRRRVELDKLDALPQLFIAS